jgi:hypothetical protein
LWHDECKTLSIRTFRRLAEGPSLLIQGRAAQSAIVEDGNKKEAM